MEGLFLAEQPVLALYSQGRLTGCVVDVGHDKTGHRLVKTVYTSTRQPPAWLASTATAPLMPGVPRPLFELCICKPAQQGHLGAASEQVLARLPQTCHSRVQRCCADVSVVLDGQLVPPSANRCRGGMQLVAQQAQQMLPQLAQLASSSQPQPGASQSMCGVTAGLGSSCAARLSAKQSSSI